LAHSLHYVSITAIFERYILTALMEAESHWQSSGVMHSAPRYTE